MPATPRHAPFHLARALPLAGATLFLAAVFFAGTPAYAQSHDGHSGHAAPGRPGQGVQGRSGRRQGRFRIGPRYGSRPGANAAVARADA